MTRTESILWHVSWAGFIGFGSFAAGAAVGFSFGSALILLLMGSATGFVLAAATDD